MSDHISDREWTPLKIALFNLITREAQTGLIFSKRVKLTDELLDVIDLAKLQQREQCLPK